MSAPTDEQLDTLRSAVSRLFAAERRLRRREQQDADTGLSSTHLRALLLLTQEESVTIGALAREADLTAASMTVAVDQLEARGLVTRERDLRDRRQCFVTLTAPGQKVVEEKQAYWRVRMAELFADVPGPKIGTAVSVLERLVEVMEGLGEPDTELDRAG